LQWFSKAEGTGLEPATGCPAPHFQNEKSRSATVQSRPKLFVGLHLRIHLCPPFSTRFREFGGKVEEFISVENGPLLALQVQRLVIAARACQNRDRRVGPFRRVNLAQVLPRPLFFEPLLMFSSGRWGGIPTVPLESVCPRPLQRLMPPNYGAIDAPPAATAYVS
jgi:hypothetical protein